MNRHSTTKSTDDFTDVLLAFSTGLLTTGVLLAATWYLFMGDEDDSSQPPTAKFTLPGSDYGSSFPWEPKGSYNPKPDASSQPSMSEQAKADQLHFLSQMTFANGGLRAPSCLCCI